MVASQNIIGTDVLDHLGLVAATIDKLGIAKHIDKLLPLGNSAKTTMGQRTAALILNGLGFIDDRLYLFPKFLGNKPVEKLFGAGVCANDFNDDSLGRLLDSIHAYGITKLYSEIALPIALKHKLLTNRAHIDTTSLSVYGEYASEEGSIAHNPPLDSNETRCLELSNQARPDYGHAKNKRVDLKQMTLLLATTGASGFPVWMESHSGNVSDKKSLEEAAERMQKFCRALELGPTLLYVGDSAMYANCVKHGKDLLWLSRVPEAMNLSKELLSKEDVDWTNLTDGYKMYLTQQDYGNVKQRWALIYSEQAYQRELLTLNKNISKEHAEISRQLWHFGNQPFGCKQDIAKQLKQFTKKIKYHEIKHTIIEIKKYNSKGRPKDDQQPDWIEYKVNAELIRDEAAIAKVKLSKGRFILATNQLDKVALADADILPTYKEQSGTESGFKFIKDDAFEVDSIFLKKPQRISALMMIMTLCLMVYSYAQYFLRQQLAKQNETVDSQSGRATNKPSMKWIYRLFHGIHVLKIKINDEICQLVLNLNDQLKRIISYFGEYACNIYAIEFKSN